MSTTAHKDPAVPAQHAEERYRLLLENANDAVYVHELSPERPGRFLEVNERACTMLGYTADELLAMEVTDIDVPEQREQLQSIIPSLYHSGRALFETEHLARDGRRIPVEVSTRLFDLHGVPTVLSVARDVSERKLAEERLRSTLTDTIRAMGELVGLRDPYTARHEKNVTRLALAIATELHLDDERREGLLLAGEVHDIGKIAVPAEILSKPAALTPMEREIVEQHPIVGRSVLSGIDFYQPVADIVGQHHERLDGSGYPDGLSGDEILLEARILAVADVVEAMASHRPYRPALGVQPALDEVRAGAGLRYDADVVTAGERVMAAGFDLHG